MKKSIVLGVRLALTLLAVAVTANAQTAEPLRKIAIGDVAPIAATWPVFVAKEKNLFAKHGLDATVTYAGSAASAVQQLVGGAYDISVSTFDSALRAAAKGAAITLIGAPVIKYPYSVMTDADITKASDMVGKTIILSFQKDITTTIWDRWLTEHGVEPKSVDQIYDGATPNRFAALSSKKVQAAFLGSPFEFRAEQAGFKKLVDFGTYAKGIAFTAIIVRQDWLKANRDTAIRYMAAVGDAIDFLYDPANKAQAIDILAKATKLDVDSATKTYDYYINNLKAFSRKAAIPADSVQAEAVVLTEMGDLKSPSEVLAGFADMSLAAK
jgi:ABC-type nitrate/sulfonate/bicarbonate transport system substrate-binding protein